MASLAFFFGIVVLQCFRCTVTIPVENGLLIICKAVTLQAWSGPEGSRKLRFPDYMTTAQDGGKVVKPYAPAAFTPRK